MAGAVVLVWEGGANLGHLGRLLPIARRLRDDGLAVVFVLARQHADSAGAFINMEGFAWELAPEGPPALRADAPVISHDDLYLRTAFAVPESSARCVLEWIALFVRLGAALVLADASPRALMAAACSEIPALAIGHGFEVPLTGSVQPCFAPWAPDAIDRMRRAREALHRNFQLLAQCMPVSLRDRVPGSLDALFSGAATALCAIEELDHFARPCRAGGQAQYVGPIWNRPSGGPALEWPDIPGPRLLAYLNLKDKRHDLLWQAARGQGFNVVVVSPGGSAKAREAARGWGIQVIGHTVDLERAVMETDAIVSHGGIGTVSMALLHGKSLLVLPEHVEQGILANRMARQGLCAATVEIRNRRRMAEQVGRLLSDKVLRVRAAQLAARYSGYRPDKAVEAVCSMVAGLLRGPSGTH